MPLPKTQEELDKVISDAVTVQLGGLQSKNTELMNEVKSLKETAKSFSNVDLKKLQEDSQELADLKTKQEEDKGEYKNLYETLKGQNDAAEIEHKKKIDTLLSDNNTLKKKSELTIALIKNNALPELTDIAVNTLLDQVEVDDNGNVMSGGKTVEEFVGEWAKSDTGTHFIKSGKSGGGANGSGDGVSEAEEAGWFKKGETTYNLTKQGQLRKSDPEKYDRLKKLHG